MRALGVVDAALIVVGSVLGAGIFLVSGVVAEEARSPAAFLGVWLVGGAVALAGALANGELGALFPRGGGEYVYLREAYGPPLGFLSGWASFWIGFPGSIATLAWGFGAATASLVGDASGRSGLPIALGSIVLLTFVDALGIGPSKWAQNVLSAAKLVAFAVLFALALLVPRHGPSTFVPFFAGGERPTHLALALVPVFFAYSGWNAATYVAGEIRSPAKNLGRALALGTLASVAVYLAVNVGYLRALPISAIAGEPDVARAAALRLGGTAAARVMEPLVALAIVGSLQATVLTGPRIYQAMAADGLFFAPLARIHPRSRVPVVALVVQAAIACALLVTGTFERLLTMTTFAILLFSTLTVGAVLVLRVKRPHLPRAFRTPASPFVPLFFIAANTWVMANVVASGAGGALLGLAIVLAGLPAYALFRRRAVRIRVRLTGPPRSSRGRSASRARPA